MSGARRWILAGALAAGCALAPGVSAAPSTVGQHHLDTGSAVVRGTDGLTYQVSFELEATSGNPSQGAVATVKYKACKRSGSCGFTYTYGLTLSASQVSFPSANSASVTATLLGKPLHLTWLANPSTPGSSFSARSDEEATIAVRDPASGGSAGFAATFFGFSCGGNGDVTNEYGVFNAPVAAATTGKSRVPAGFATKRGHKPACESSA